MPENPPVEAPRFPVSEQNLKRYETDGYFIVDHASHTRQATPTGSASDFLGAVSRNVDGTMVAVSRNLVYDPLRKRVIPLIIRGRNREQDRITILEALRDSGKELNPIETLDRSLLVFITSAESSTPKK